MLNKKEIDNYFMKKAIAISKKSDDPRTKVGCVFVKNGKVIASGFNAYSPRFKKSKRIYDPIDKKHDWLHSKYPYIVHAEMRAVLDSANKGVSLKGSTCYVTLMSCNECAKNMAHLGIKEVVYMEDRNDPLFVASHKTFECTGVKQRQIKLA